VLRLNHNLVTMITPPPSNGPRMGVASLGALEVLQLGFNQIVDIPSLFLHRLPNLKVLHLQGNEITRVEGLNEMYQLRELNLDRNKIRALDAQSLASLSSLLELRLEENGLRTLDHLVGLPRLTTLAAGSNRISEVSDLDKLEVMPCLQHLTLANNAVARKQLEVGSRAAPVARSDEPGPSHTHRPPPSYIPLSLLSRNWVLITPNTPLVAFAKVQARPPHVHAVLPRDQSQIPLSLLHLISHRYLRRHRPQWPATVRGRHVACHRRVPCAYALLCATKKKLDRKSYARPRMFRQAWRQIWRPGARPG